MKNKFVNALLSLVIAFGIWMYVVSVVAPESERTYMDVPVRIHGSNILESRGLMLISDQDLTVDLELSGTRADLNELSSANITVIADLSGITGPGEHQVSYSVSYPGSISSAITIQSPTTQTVTVQVVEWEQKTVPIEVEYVGKLPEGFEVDSANVALSKDKVTISGKKDVVNQIKKAVVTVDLTGHTTNIDQVYTLSYQDATGEEVELEHVTADTEKVTAVLKINMVQTLPIELNINPGDLLEGEYSCVSNLKFITVSGPAELVQAMESFVVDVNLSGLLESDLLRVPLIPPAGLTILDDISEMEVEATVPKMATIKLQVSTSGCKCINVPEGYEAIVSSINREIMLYGRENRLKLLTEENIQMTVDLSTPLEDDVYKVEVVVIGVDGIQVLSSTAIPVDLIEVQEE